MTDHTDTTRVVLTINLFDSICGACGKSCYPFEKAHKRPCGYDQHPGCGAVYTHVWSNYVGLNMKQRCQEMRPDLTWCGFDELEASRG